MCKSTKFITLDIHQNSIIVALAGEGRKDPHLYGTIPPTDAALPKLAGQLAGLGTSLRFLLRGRSLRLNSFLQRHGRIYSGRSRWTQAHFRWLETQRFDHPAQQIVVQEYVDAVKQAQGRIQGLDQALQQTLEEWSLEEETNAMRALRGVDTLHRRHDPGRAGGPHPLRLAAPADGLCRSGPREHHSGSRTDRTRHTGHCLEGTETPVRTLSTAEGTRDAEEQNLHRSRAGAVGLHLGYRLGAATPRQPRQKGASGRRLNRSSPQNQA